ncbi:MAG: response regulator transcription factor [Desulfotomaculaceae bacterium]|nr:response regulator transcription factor [Desulfotomaculaceae bacterium]
MPRILVVEDEKNILELVRYNLEREGYQAITALDGVQGLELAQSQDPDLIVLDVMLPEMNGLEVCQKLRHSAQTKNIPIVMLSARAEELDRVRGLEMGADDYVTKPFSPRELVARINARLRSAGCGEKRKAKESGQAHLRLGCITIDEERLNVYANGINQELTLKEFELLRFMASRPGMVFPREQLFNQIWGFDHTGDSRIVDVHVRLIRQKLGHLPGGEQMIEPVRGVGYRFKTNVPKMG